nr:MAG TPA: hypothetical protein [Caudoviricetes sp.]
MNNQIQVINVSGIDCYEKDGTAYLNLEAVARGLGFTKRADSGNEVVNWTRVRSYLSSFGVVQKCTTGDYIPENVFYRLAMKAKNEAAEKFQAFIADEVIPSIRKHGAYMTQETLQEAFCNPDSLLKIAMALKEESDKRKALEAKNSELEVAMTIAAPKVEYYEELCDRNALTGIYETAKLLGVPPRRFTEALVKHHYLFRNKKGVLMPCEAKNDGLFEVKEVLGESNKWSGTQTLITVKCRDVFRMMRLGV